MQTIRLTALAMAAALSLAACGADTLVSAERSDRSGGPETPLVERVPQIDNQPGTTGTTPPNDPADPNTPTTTEPVLAPTTDPSASTTTSAPVETTPLVIDEQAINFGVNKPAREYDDFLLATLTDLNLWWSEAYPLLYGDPWQPLEGDVFAAYPERVDDLPGCGEPRTNYPDVQEFVAFYCGIGDFIVYDDGPEGLLAGLAAEYGAGTIGIVLAHEFGHAIQQRSGVLDLRLPTVTTEQQADCFAGAWAGRAASGAGGVNFSDEDVGAGLIAMLEVRDPVGIDQFSPGGHGSGFDRVGAFQVGFRDGVERCGRLIDDPLPLMPNQFNDPTDIANEGNAPFGYGEDELLGFLVADLNLYWSNDAAISGFDPLELQPVDTVDEAQCDDLQPGLEAGAALCPSADTVYLHETVALDLYGQRAFGDFSIGYLIGVEWADDVQSALGSNRSGEERELANDCLAGAWVQTVIPVNFALPQPRDPDRTAVVSPGDLDEAIRTAILIADDRADDNVLGSAFEKIDAFRRGVIGGLDACSI